MSDRAKDPGRGLFRCAACGHIKPVSELGRLCLNAARGEDIGGASDPAPVTPATEAEPTPQMEEPTDAE